MHIILLTFVTFPAISLCFLISMPVASISGHLIFLSSLQIIFCCIPFEINIQAPVNVILSAVAGFQLTVLPILLLALSQSPYHLYSHPGEVCILSKNWKTDINEHRCRSFFKGTFKRTVVFWPRQSDSQWVTSACARKQPVWKVKLSLHEGRRHIDFNNYSLRFFISYVLQLLSALWNSWRVPFM